jgi:NtrC-family two-component system response regulator AlgB
MARILIVDDDPGIRSHLAAYVGDLDHDLEIAADATIALAATERGSFDVVLSDVRMAGMDGFALLRELRRRHPETGVVLMTAYATVPDAVEAMREGAYDYLMKPFSLDQVGLVLDRLLEVQALRRENRTLRRAVDAPPLLESQSPVMQRILETARRAAASDTTVLLTGESGVGKNVLAAAMHRWSARASRPFVTVACTTLVEHLLESELFGHVRGAFTGAWRDKPGRLEAAEGGTAFLDEAGDLPMEVQAKLLRFLEERCFERVGGAETITVATRVIAATSRDLIGDVRAGRFREDLYYRLNVITLRLPPLRERREDLPALTDHILRTLSARHRRGGLMMTPAARRAIETYPWPGNVRELFNALERAVVLTRAKSLDAEDLPDQVLAPAPELPAPSLAALPSSLAELERQHVQRVLAESATLEEAAARLGINPTTLWRKRKRWGLD